MDEFSHTQEALGDLLGKSRSHVANMMRLLSLPNAVKTLLETGKLSAGHGRALLGADDPAALARDVVKKGLNVRQTEKLVKSGKIVNKAGTEKRIKDSNTVALEHDLAVLLGLQVTIDFKDPGGKLVIAYESLEQLDEILKRLKGRGDPKPIREKRQFLDAFFQAKRYFQPIYRKQDLTSDLIIKNFGIGGRWLPCPERYPMRQAG